MAHKACSVLRFLRNLFNFTTKVERFASCLFISFQWIEFWWLHIQSIIWFGLTVSESITVGALVSFPGLILVKNGRNWARGGDGDPWPRILLTLLLLLLLLLHLLNLILLIKLQPGWWILASGTSVSGCGWSILRQRLGSDMNVGLLCFMLIYVWNCKWVDSFLCSLLFEHCYLKMLVLWLKDWIGFEEFVISSILRIP